MAESKPRRRITAADRRYLQEVNAALITKDEIVEFVRETNALEPEDRGFEAFSVTAIRLHPGNVEKVGALMFRMQALAHLIESPDMKGWTYPKAPDGATWTSEPVFAATAVQPVVIIDGKPAFEAESFRRKVLELADLDEEA